MIIMGQRNYSAEEASEKAIEFAPNVWAHARTMQWWNKMNAFDQETFKKMLASSSPISKGLKWVGSVPESVAAAVNQTNPEIFNDITGKAYMKFLERNPQYKVPDSSSRKYF